MADTELEPPFHAYEGDAPFVFVSYSHKDAPSVFPELKRLHGLAYRIWYDEGIDPGNEWPEEIANALENSAQFIVFISPNAVVSRNVRNEIQMALELGKPFLAIHLSETQLPSGVRLSIGALQAVMMYRMSPDSYHRKIEKALPETLLDKSALSEKSPGREAVEAVERERIAEGKRKAEEEASRLAAERIKRTNERRLAAELAEQERIEEERRRAEEEARRLEAELAKRVEEQRRKAEITEQERIVQEKRNADEEAVRLIEIEQEAVGANEANVGSPKEPKIHRINELNFLNNYPRSKYGVSIISRLVCGACAVIPGFLTYSMVLEGKHAGFILGCFLAIPVLIFGLFTYGCLAVAFRSEKEAIIIQAIRETGKKAEKGNSNEQFNMGLLYWKKRDYKDAQKWFQKAAEAGHREAQNSMGYICESGLDGQKDIQQALSWYRKAAESGSVYAKQNLNRLGQ